jgi:hypothetical protein
MPQLATNRSDNHNDNTEDDDRLPEAVYNEPDDDVDDDQDEEQGDGSLDEETDWCALLHNRLAHSSLDATTSRSSRDRTWLPLLWKSMHGIPPKLPLALLECLATPPFAGTRDCVYGSNQRERERGGHYWCVCGRRGEATIALAGVVSVRDLLRARVRVQLG